MLDPAAEVKSRPRHFECRRRRFGALFNMFDLSFQFVGYALVSIEAEDPIVRGLLGGEVFLSRVAGPGPNEYAIREAARNLNSVIGAFRVDDHDFVRPRQ